jgi:ketosteroid isomerase-like protein
MDFAQLTDRFSAAIAAGDGEALADLFTEDGTYDDYFFGPRSGRDGIKETLREFYVGGEKFRFEFHDLLSDGRMAYARYRFSYTSKAEATPGKRICFEGTAQFRLRDGLISLYSETFDRSQALVQQDFEAERIKRIALKYAKAMHNDPAWADHLKAG